MRRLFYLTKAVSGKIDSGWFRVGVPLSEARSTFLMVISFLLPLLLWCFAAYAPFLWKVDYRINLTAVAEDKELFAATYVAGDTMEAGRFRKFQKSIREDNNRLEKSGTSGISETKSPRVARAANKKLLRDFEPVLVKNGLFDQRLKQRLGTKDYYQQLYSTAYETWGKLSRGDLKLKPGSLTRENLEIIGRNYKLMAEISSYYDSNNLFSKPIYKLIPEGTKQVGRPSYLPAPHEVVEKGWENFSGSSELGNLELWRKYGESLRIVFFGFFMACVFGVPIALMAGTFPFFSRLVEPFADFFRYMPAPAFSTVLIAVFGLAESPKIALVVIGTLPHLILMVANTTRMVDSSLIDAGQTLGAKGGNLIRKVVIPAVLPNLYNDLRILLGWAWTWLVIAELIGMKSGLTEIIDTQGRRFHFDHVYPVIFLIGITGFVTDQMLAGFREILFPWTSGGKVGVVAKVFILPGRIAKWLVSGRIEPGGKKELVS
ncbi:MAG: ABC transporter permease [Armatimonadetes bacterium]|nr:ABC transporter permease [Akkermansiaceae bacterium]